jgi:hypothetical protein
MEGSSRLRKISGGAESIVFSSSGKDSEHLLGLRHMPNTNHTG